MKTNDFASFFVVLTSLLTGFLEVLRKSFPKRDSSLFALSLGVYLLLLLGAFNIFLPEILCIFYNFLYTILPFQSEVFSFDCFQVIYYEVLLVPVCFMAGFFLFSVHDGKPYILLSIGIILILILPVLWINYFYSYFLYWICEKIVLLCPVLDGFILVYIMISCLGGFVFYKLSSILLSKL